MATVTCLELASRPGPRLLSPLRTAAARASVLELHRGDRSVAVQNAIFDVDQHVVLAKMFDTVFS